MLCGGLGWELGDLVHGEELYVKLSMLHSLTMNNFKIHLDGQKKVHHNFLSNLFKNPPTLFSSLPTVASNRPGSTFPLPP